MRARASRSLATSAGVSNPVSSLDLNFAAIGAPIAGQDGRAAPWWNLFRGGVSEPDVFFDGNGVLSYGAHNGVSWSQDFTQSIWSKVNAFLSGSPGVAPDGTNTATLWIPTCTASTSRIRRVDATTTNDQSWSVFVRPNGYTKFGIREDASAGAEAAFDCTGAGSVYRTSAGVTASITSVGGGWYRLTYRASNYPSGSVFGLYVLPPTHGPSDPVSIFWTSNAVDGFFVWGAQINWGPLLPYTPTTNTAIWSTVPRITYSRASLATMIGPDGLVRWAPHNLLTWSEDFSNGAWSKLRSGTGVAPIVTTGFLAPDGTNTACRIQFDLGATPSGADSRIIQSVSATATTANYSLWLRTNDGSTVNLGMRYSGIDAMPVVVTPTWQRFTFSSNDTTPTISFGLFGWRGHTGTADLLAWGAQINVGPLQPYYPTGASAYFGPRFVYDPVTLAAQGLLVEEQRTNLALQSNLQSASSWTTDNATFTSNSAVGPDGLMSAATMTETSGTARHIVYQGLTVPANTTYTCSVYVKAGSGRYFQVSFGGNAGSLDCVVDLQNGAITSTNSSGSPSVTGYRVVSHPNGWYRVILTVSIGASSGTSYIVLAGSDVPVITNFQFGNASYAGAGRTWLLWGAQLEAGSFPTTYISTTSASVTRLADSAQMTGTSFSSWYRQDLGAFTLDARHAAQNGVTNYYAGVLSAGAANVVGFNAVSRDIRFTVGPTNIAFNVLGATDAEYVYKVAFSYKDRDYSNSLNGGAVSTNTTEALGVGASFNITPAKNYAVIRRIRYFNRTLPANQLQRLTV